METRKASPLLSSAGPSHTLTAVGSEAWENMYLWNTLVSVPESSFEPGGCGRQPEGAHFQVKLGLGTWCIGTKWMWGKGWSTWEITGVSEEIEEWVQWELGMGGVEGRANNGGRRNSCREVHWGRVVARRGMKVLGMMDLLLGQEATWKQWKKTQYSCPKMGCVSSASLWNWGWGGYEVWAHPAAWDVAGQDGLRREGTEGISHCFPNIWDDWYIQQDVLLFVSWITDSNLHIVLLLHCSLFSNKLSLSVMVLPGAVCFLLPCTSRLLLAPQCFRDQNL